jgi:hypothetical protein
MEAAMNSSHTEENEQDLGKVTEVEEFIAREGPKEARVLLIPARDDGHAAERCSGSPSAGVLTPRPSASPMVERPNRRNETRTACKLNGGPALLAHRPSIAVWGRAVRWL